MARKPRKRVALSFSEDHRLAPAFTAAGLGAVPAAADVRALIELGLAAKAAGLMSVRGSHGAYHLVQAFAAGALAGSASAPLPAMGVPAPAANHDAGNPSAPSPTEKAADNRDEKNVDEDPKGKANDAVKHRRTSVHGGQGTDRQAEKNDAEDDARAEACNELEIDPETRSLLANALNF